MVPTPLAKITVALIVLAVQLLKFDEIQPKKTGAGGSTMRPLRSQQYQDAAGVVGSRLGAQWARTAPKSGVQKSVANPRQWRWVLGLARRCKRRRKTRVGLHLPWPGRREGSSLSWPAGLLTLKFQISIRNMFGCALMPSFGWW